MASFKASSICGERVYPLRCGAALLGRRKWTGTADATSCALPCPQPLRTALRPGRAPASASLSRMAQW
eukprot:274197-Prymnesium_polylepis.2